MVLVETTDGLHALSLDGRPMWNQDVRDVLVVPPVQADGRVLAVSKSNDIWVLDRRTGAVIKRTKWPTWVTHATLIKRETGTCVAIVDLRNRLSLLGFPSLRLLACKSFNWRLPPEVKAVAQVPFAWRLPRHGRLDEFEGMVGAKRARKVVLCQDNCGFVYLVPLPE